MWNVQGKPNLLKYQLIRTKFIPTELDIGPRLGYTSFLEWLALFLQTSGGRRCIATIDPWAIGVQQKTVLAARQRASRRPHCGKKYAPSTLPRMTCETSALSQARDKFWSTGDMQRGRERTDQDAMLVHMSFEIAEVR